MTATTSRFSIRELLYLFAAVSFVLFAFTTLGLFAGGAAMLLVGIVFVAKGQIQKRRFLVCTGLGLVVQAFFALGMGFAAWMMFGVGPVYFSHNYPYELAEMARAMNADVYCLGRFIDEEYVCKINISHEQFDRLATTQAYASVPKALVTTEFWSAFPNYLRPRRTQNFQFRATPGFPATGRSPDGEYTYLAYDANRELLYVWHKFNF